MSHLFATNCSFHHMNTKLDKVSLWWTCLKVSLMRNLICTVEYWTKMEQRDFWIVLAHRQSDKYHCFSDLPVLDKWICSGCGAIAAGCDRGTTMETKQSKNTAAISRHHLLITPSNFSIEIRYYALVFEYTCLSSLTTHGSFLLLLFTRSAVDLSRCLTGFVHFAQLTVAWPNSRDSYLVKQTGKISGTSISKLVIMAGFENDNKKLTKRTALYGGLYGWVARVAKIFHCESF